MKMKFLCLGLVAFGICLALHLVPRIVVLDQVQAQAQPAQFDPTLNSAVADPTAAYQREVIQGFTILINPEVLTHPPEVQAMRQEITSQLTMITQVVPTRALSALKNVRIWVEWENRPDGAAEFHPSAEWLQQHGYNPDKAGDVEISNVRNFVAWSQADQPWLMLHELAHAYHHHVLGQDYAAIEAAYQHAVTQKLYESVTYIHGNQQRAYALTNQNEYFAELSEAYFGQNDFYPFTRSELQQYDPVGYQLMETAWGRA